MTLTSKQMVLIRYHSKKSWVSTKDIVDWINEWKVTITEIVNGILWEKA